MSTLAEYQAAFTVTGKNIDQFNSMFASYQSALQAALDQDPCVKGFDATIAKLDEQRTQVKNFYTNELFGAYNAQTAIYQSLSNADKRIAVKAQNAFTDSLNAINTAVKEWSAKALFKKLEENYNSCPVLKDPPEEEESEEDEEQDDVQDGEEGDEEEGENEAEDDEGEDDEPSDEPDSDTSPTKTTVAGKSDTPASDKTKKPNKRQKNPLGNLSSYSYNLTLYMITPEAYNAFIASGRKNINAVKNAATTSAAQDLVASNEGAYIIAQTAGVDNAIDARAPGFIYDYYIDNLKLTTAITAATTQSETSTNKITFDIIEPYGFSFISNLTRARNAIMKNSKLPNAKDNSANLKQIFVLGIRFYGYDKNGNVATTADFSAEDTINPASQAGGGGDTALFERFFDISIVKLQFKLDGKATIYNVTANALGEQTAMTTRNGRINKDIQVTASTVYEALMGDNGNAKGLLTSLNDQQKQMEQDKKIEIPNEYDVVFVGDESDINELKNASMIIPTDTDKLKSGMVANNVTESNANLEASVFPRLGYKQIKFKNDSAILQCISLLIGQSQYLFQAQNTVFSAEIDADAEDDEEKPASKQRIRWYNIGAEVEIKGFDNKKKEWAYKITYVIQPYETPYFFSPYANLGIKYYGPHKRYDYWYTGKNSEVIRYEQQINGNFFTVALGTAEEGADKELSTGQPQLAMQPQMRTPMARQGMTGVGMEAQNTYLTSLYDPASWASAKVKILGDPDFLMQTAPNTLSQVYSKDYGPDGFTINPNGGQVFVEIDFKEAEDYKHQDGLMSLNESIQFVDLPDEVKKIVKGVSYQVLKCESEFRNGSFTQDLTLNITNWAGIIKKKEEEQREAPTSSAQDPRARGIRSDTAGNSTTPSGTVKTSGLKDYTDPTQNSPEENNSSVPTFSPSKTASPRSADDDANPVNLSDITGA